MNNSNRDGQYTQAFPFHIEHGSTPSLVNRILTEFDFKNQPRASINVSRIAERRKASSLVSHQVPFLEQLGIIFGRETIYLADFGICLLAIYQKTPSLVSEAVHLRLFTLFFQDQRTRFSWAYHHLLTRLWEGSAFLLSRADREALAGEIRQLAMTTFGLSRVAFSADSVAGALHWLAALDPPVAKRNGILWTVRRRTTCPPETVLWLLDILRRRHHLELGAPFPAATLDTLTIAAMLEPHALRPALEQAAARFPSYLTLDPAGAPRLVRPLPPGALPAT